jgi:integrase/recombinase XerD
MLAALFPRAYARYSSLPILGSSLDGLCFWLHARGYPRDAIQRRMRAAASLDRALRRRGVRSLSALTATMLRSYAPPPRWSGSPPRGALVRSIALYLEERGELAPTLPTPTEHQIADYRHYLEHIRGLCDSTIALKSATAREFLLFVDHDIRPEELHDLRIADIEAFVAKIGQRVGRDRLGNVIAALRMFLRFLAVKGKVTPGLDSLIDSPRVYRGERLPRALAWETVRMLLRSIDRTTPKGRRDYAMFLVIATYGLRASEVRTLDLDDIAWRARQIRFPRPKVGTPLLLPLTDEVGTALIDYLRHSRPRAICRRIFLRVEIPIGPLGRGAIGDAFRTWARRAGIALPVPGGPHSLRHALALHLLREGAALKTIGDLLGHRSAEATGRYLRLNVDDLRDVALQLPPAAAAEEVRP